MKELMDILQMVQPKPDMEDNFVWWKYDNGFSVKSSYLMMLKFVMHVTWRKNTR